MDTTTEGPLAAPLSRPALHSHNLAREIREIFRDLATHSMISGYDYHCVTLDCSCYMAFMDTILGANRTSFSVRKYQDRIYPPHYPEARRHHKLIKERHGTFPFSQVLQICPDVLCNIRDDTPDVV